VIEQVDLSNLPVLFQLHPPGALPSEHAYSDCSSGFRRLNKTHFSGPELASLPRCRFGGFLKIADNGKGEFLHRHLAEILKAGCVPPPNSNR
jgi:hypothetical protein